VLFKPQARLSHVAISGPFLIACQPREAGT
jgi:hypothetical protein